MKQIYKNKVSFKETVSIECSLVKETEKAFLIEPKHGGDETWVPKSQIATYHSANKEPYDVIVMSQWIAETKGLDNIDPAKPKNPPKSFKGTAPTINETPTQDSWDDDMPF